MKLPSTQTAFFCLILSAMVACTDNNTSPSATLIADMQLKTGEIISCGPSENEYGSLAFEVTANAEAKKDFVLGLKLLHSFEYEEAEKAFANAISKDPGCAMAYWGVAMSNFHALWAPPSEAELRKGAKATEIANSIKEKTEREAAFIEAISAYYRDYAKTDHRTRCLNFEMAMDTLRSKYPDDKEAAIFYALALTAAADPADKSFTKQKKAGDILNALYPGEPNHPGIVHYIIHSYDFPELAEKGLAAARKYASIAPSSAHALHMPSHIFTRLGYWDECVKSNLASVSSAQCYAKQTGIKGHWDEEIHGLDYLVYAYLQKGQNDKAKKQLDYLESIQEIHPANFKVAYGVASMPSRYVLENKMWTEAASLKLQQKNISWQEFPWQKALFHFARALGAVHTGKRKLAETELTELKGLYQELTNQKDTYKAGQVEVQIKIVEAWTQFKKRKNDEALRLMNLAAELESKTEKHPVTPGELIPAQEMLGDLLMQMNRYDEALAAFELNLKKHPNRFNGLYSAALSAERCGEFEKAKKYYKQLLRTADPRSERLELGTAKDFLSQL